MAGDRTPFLANLCSAFLYHRGTFPFLWKAKFLLKVRAFMWTLVLRRININDLLQTPKMKTRDGYFVIYVHYHSESRSHVFLQCEMENNIWRRLFVVFGEYLIIPCTVLDMLQVRLLGFERANEKKIWCQNAFNCFECYLLWMG